MVICGGRPRPFTTTLGVTDNTRYPHLEVVFLEDRYSRASLPSRGRSSLSQGLGVLRPRSETCCASGSRTNGQQERRRLEDRRRGPGGYPQCGSLSGVKVGV